MPDRPPPRPARRWWRRAVPAWTVPVLLVAVLLAGEAGARIVGPEIPRSAGSEERLLIKSDQIFDRGSGATDVIFLGSSESAGGLVPSVVDAEAAGLDGMYNAALSGASLELTDEWVRRVVVPHLRPKVAVIGMLPISVLDGAFVAGEAGLDQQRQALDAYRAALDQVDPSGWLGSGWELRQRSALVRYRPYLRSPSLAVRGVTSLLGHGPDEPDDDAPVDWLTETDPGRIAASTGADGEIYDYHQPSTPIVADPLGAGIYGAFAKAGTDFSELEALTDWLVAHDVTPVLAIAPADRGPLVAGGADLGPLDAIVAEIEDWAAERSIAVDDQFTKDWDTPLFHDRNHLDEEGAVRWSEEVGRWLDGLCRDGALEGCGS